jgi:hypothetical protein
MNYLTGLVFAVLLALAGGDVQAQISDINSAINKAGRQRMLSQRMAKAYFQIGQQVELERSKKVLDVSVALFDRQLVELKNYSPTPEIRETYQKLETSWLAYKDVLLGAVPAPDNGRKVLELSETVLALAQQGTVLLEKYSGSNAGRANRIPTTFASRKSRNWCRRPTSSASIRCPTVLRRRPIRHARPSTVFCTAPTTVCWW